VLDRRPGRDRLRGWAAPLALAAATVALRLPSLYEPRWYSDEGTFTTVAWVLARGGRLYADAFDNSPPGIYWIYRALLALGADRSHLVVQLALLAAVAVSVLLTYRIARGIDRRLALPAALVCAAVLSLPTFDGDRLNVEVAALPFFLGALALAGPGGVAGAAASGALLAAALLVRPSYALDGIAVALLLLLAPRPGRRIVAAAGGGIAVLALAIGALALQGSLNAYLAYVLPDNRAYLLMANGGSLLPLAVRLAALGAAAGFWYGRVEPTPWRLLALWLPASIAGASLPPRELTHYVLEAAPPLAIGLTAPAFRLARWPRPGSVVAWLAGLGAVIAVLVASEAVLVLPAEEAALLTRGKPATIYGHAIPFSALPAYYWSWITGGFDSPRAFPGPMADEAAEGDLIAGTPSLPQGPLLVLGDRAWIYFLSGREPALRYVALNSAFRLVPGGGDQIRTALQARRPRLVVLADAPAGDWRAILEAAGYREVAAAPYPLFRASG
jgi:hypothetical protein